jgi:hypothetical protein
MWKALLVSCKKWVVIEAVFVAGYVKVIRLIRKYVNITIGGIFLINLSSL